MKRVILLMLPLLVSTLAVAGPSIVGSMQGWDPADSTYNLVENANGVWELTKTLAAGTHSYKVVETDDWSANFPANNQSFTLTAEEEITWKVNLGANIGSRDWDEYVFHSPNPPVVVGDFLSEIGGTDWDVTTTLTQMVDDGSGGDVNADDDIYTYQNVIPAGTYEYKVVLNNNWDQDTSPSGNISFTSNGVDITRFTYDMSNNTTSHTSLGAPEVSDVQQYNKTKVDVIYNTDMDTSGTSVSANNPNNYTISSKLTVSSIDIISAQIMRLNLDSELTNNTVYTVSVDPNVESATGVPMNPAAVSDSFTSYTYAPITFVVDDSYGQTHPIFYLKGSWDTETGTYDAGWSGGAEHTPFYDDGTHGDTLSADHIFMVTVDLASDGGANTWEWGINDSAHIWMDGNFPFTISDATPQTLTYTVPFGISQDVTVTFRVYMGQLDSLWYNKGVSVQGSVSPLDWIPGSNLMSDPDENLIYTIDIIFPTGSIPDVEYKFTRKDNDENWNWESVGNRSFTINDSNSTQMLNVDYWDDNIPSPQNVIISVVGQDVHLSWDAVPGATNYEVLRSSDPYSGFTHLANTGTATNYIDSGAGSKYRAEKYFYQIKTRDY